MKTQFDVIVIGAGPAGSVAAAYLLKQGYSVAVIEKAEFPRFVIGESLLPHCMDFLDDVGLVQAVHDQGFQLKTGVTFYHDDEVCHFPFNDQFTDGWDYTYQVKRADFDHTLIREVEKKGADVYFGSEVTAVEAGKEKQTVEFTDKDGKQHRFESRFLLDASGYGRVLPRLFNLDTPIPTEPRGALFCHIHDKKRDPNAADNIFVHAFDNNNAWIWSIPFSDKTASVGIVGSVDLIKEFSENGNEKFMQMMHNFPGLADRFEDADLVFEPRSILNYACSVSKLYGDGYALCGNATEFLDPIFSSGVTLAVSSGHKAASLADRELKGEHVDWQTEYADHMKSGIDAFRTYVNSWYNGDLATIFFSENPEPEIKQQICSVLAGYVWDQENPFVRKHSRAVPALATLIRSRESAVEND